MPYRLKLILICVLYFLKEASLPAQKLNIDSLAAAIQIMPSDSFSVLTLNTLSADLMNKSLYSEALLCAEHALEKAERISYKQGAARSINNIGNTYYYLGNYAKAVENYFKALKIYESTGNKSQQALTLNNIGLMFDEQGELTQALDYYNKSLKISEEINNKSGIARALGNIGNVYSYKNDVDKALEYYFKCIPINDELKDTVSKAINISNIGMMYSKQNKQDKALEFLFQALSMRTELKDKRGMGINFANIGGVYLLQKKYKQAEEYLIRALTIAKEIGDLKGQEACYEELSKLYKERKLWQQAMEHYQQYTGVKDSLYNQVKTKQIAEMQAKYDAENKENQIKLRDIQIEKEQQSKKQLIALVIIILIAAVVIYNRNKVKQKLFLENEKNKAKNEILELQQKVLLTQMNPHFIFNSLKSIQNFVLDNNTEKASNYIAEFGQLMRLVLEATRKEYITLEDEIKILDYYLRLEKARVSNHFTFEFHLEKMLEDKLDEYVIPSMLLQPIVENAVHHGVNRLDKPNGKIDISFSLANEQLLKIEVVDNGKGIDDPSYKSDGLSISSRIIEERIRNFNQTHTEPITYSIENMKKHDFTGTKVNLTLPLLEHAA